MRGGRRGGGEASGDGEPFMFSLRRYRGNVHPPGPHFRRRPAHRACRSMDAPVFGRRGSVRIRARMADGAALSPGARQGLSFLTVRCGDGGRLESVFGRLPASFPPERALRPGWARHSFSFKGCQIESWHSAQKRRFCHNPRRLAAAAAFASAEPFQGWTALGPSGKPVPVSCFLSRHTFPQLPT